MAIQDPPERHRDVASDGGGGTTLREVRLLARGTAVLVSTGVISYAGSFLLTVILARRLGPLAFGLWAIAFSLSRLLSIVGLFGADWLVLRQGSYYHGVGDVPRLRRTIQIALLLAGGGLLVLAIAIAGGAGWIARSVFEEPDLVPLLWLTALMAPIVGVRQILVYGTQAFKEMRDAALLRNILQPLLRLLFVGVAVVASASVLTAYVALVVSEVILAIVAFVLLRRRMPLFGDVADVDARHQLGFALPAWLTRLAGQSRAQVLTVMLGSLATVATSGVFTVANRVAGILFSIVTTLNQVYTAIASDLYLQGRRREWASTYRSATKWTFTMGAPLLALMLAFPAEVLSIFGEGFRSGATALVVVSVGMLFHFGTGPVTVTLVLIGRPRLALLDYVVVIAVEIGLALWLIPRYGLIGAAVAKAVGTATNNVVPLVQVWRSEGAWPFRLDFWKPAAAAVVAALVARAAVSALPLGAGTVAAFAGAAVIAAVYLPLVWLLGLSDEDRAALDAFRFRRKARGGVADGDAGTTLTADD